MSYYLIEGQPVFLPVPRYKKLQDEALKDKSATFRVASHIAGTEEGREAEKLMYETLETKYRADPEVFRQEWGEFDLRGEEARMSVWDLFYDYCHYYGYATVIDIRDEVERIVADYVDDSYNYPMGRVFALDHRAPPSRSWWQFIPGEQDRTVRIVIDSTTIERAVGSLKSFVVTIPGYIVRCGRNCEIIPAGTIESKTDG